MIHGAVGHRSGLHCGGAMRCCPGLLCPRFLRGGGGRLPGTDSGLRWSPCSAPGSEGLAVVPSQSGPQHSCIPCLCRYKNINQKGLKQVQGVQTDTKPTLLVQEKTELVRLRGISYRKGKCRRVEILKH